SKHLGYVLHYLFEYTGHSRNLHSFPTRRSSDLAALELEIDQQQPDDVRRQIHHKHDREDPRVRQPDSEIEREPRIFTIVFVVNLDRKSTRLNSSHLVISYAVFCLKKKK